MVKIITLLLMLSSLIGFLPQQEKCKCKKPQIATASEEANEKRIEDYVYREMYGQVQSINGDPLEGIIVEIYDHPEVGTDPANNSQVSQQKLASCKTGKGGMFCFEGLKQGEYEVRLIDAGGAKSSGPWEDRSWKITIDPDHAESTDKMIEVYMTLRI